MNNIREKIYLNKKNALLLLALFTYILSVQFAYQFFMLKKWGTDFLETSWGKGANVSNIAFYIFLLLAFGAFLTSRMEKRASDYLHLLFFLAPIVPMGIISANKGVGLSYYFLVMVAFTISYTISCIKFPKIRINLKLGFITEKNYLLICVILGFFIIAWAIINGGLEYINFDFSQVYEYRRGASDSRGVLLNYILLNYIGTLLALGFAIAFSNKSIFYIFLLLAINVIIFALTSNKSYLFVGAFTMALYIIINTPFPKLYLILGFISVVVGLTVLYLIFPQQWIWATLFVRRFIFVPAYVNFLYWDFFTQHPFAFWSDSKVSLGLVESVYGRPTPQIIGDFYSGKDFSDTAIRYNNANTAWLGSGYGNAGAIGVLIYAVLSGIITKFANMLGKLIGNRLAFVALAFYFFTIFFSSTDLPAALLSYGFFSFIIILIFWKKHNIHQSNKKMYE